MRKLTIYSILCFFIFVSCKNEEKQTNPKTLGLLTISKEYPQPGDNLDLTYKSADSVDAIYVYMVGDKNYPVDIDLDLNNNEQTGSIKIPDSAVALGFIFKNDQNFDSNEEKGYFVPLYNDDDKPLAGSNAAVAFYSVNYGPNYGIKLEGKEAHNIIKQDLDNHPELKKDWHVNYLRMAYENDKENSQPLIQSYLDSLSQKSNKTEQEYASMVQFYNMMGDRETVDRIKTETIEKYPNGNMASYSLAESFQKESDLDKKAELFEKYKNSNAKLGNIGNYMAGNLAQAYYKSDNMEAFEKVTSKMDDKDKAALYNSIAWPMAEKGEHLEKAETISKTSLDLLKGLEDSHKDKPDYFSQRQYEKNLKSTYRMYADTYALILFKQNKIKDAITYQEKALDPKRRDVETNERYIDYLMADKQYDLVIKNAEDFIKSGHGNEKISEAYKTAYNQTNPENKDVNEKLAAFEKEAYQTQIAEIKKTMIDEEAYAFNLKDMKGNDVALSSLKGKTVILDFWATWCGPCKASFPGMQEVVTKYKDNDNVVLLFVDTFERGANREKMVEDFIKTSNYDFNVVYDKEIDGGKDFEVAGKYGITGIPTKVIIGPDGRVKFKSVGYNGSNTKLVKEMDIMIDILKS